MFARHFKKELIMQTFFILKTSDFFILTHMKEQIIHCSLIWSGRNPCKNLPNTVHLYTISCVDSMFITAQKQKKFKNKETRQTEEQ